MPYYTDRFGSGYVSVNVIFHDEAVFLHKRPQFFGCGTTNLAPDIIQFIELQPEQLKKIHNVNQIVKEIRTSREKALEPTRHFVTFSSLSDTITNPIFDILVDSLKITNPWFFVRRITEEEHHVLDAKTKNIPYNPKNYTWTMNYRSLPFEK